ncbi:cell wall hydrolase [Rhodopseudomonas sp. B29]|uniref:cell wall hydrolase n=1 Tax=Rhodopseudomonas sp. B29 TaxID=95607 RepID=UPI0004CDED32|nr:cell wall hydrolase [Rhodopseudomonas sp. B29]
MSVMRNRPKAAMIAAFGLGLFVFGTFPTEIGYQDIASLLVRQPGVAERWQQRSFHSALGSMQLASFSFGRPIGTWTPHGETYRLGSEGQPGLISRNPLLRPPARYQASDFPKVDRTLKGDRLAIATPDQSEPEERAVEPPLAPGAKVADKVSDRAPEQASADSPLDPELSEALNSEPLQQYDVTAPLGETHPAIAASPAVPPAEAAPRDPFAFKTASLFFGSSSMGWPEESLEAWQPGAEPVIVSPGLDPEMKSPLSSLPADSAGESTAGKGEVNAAHHIKTPAERLGLTDPKARAKQEKCLTEAVYFESRGEKVRGQIAVAQVVLNRVFSGFYPTTVCGVVYQNKNRHYACQFTFACDDVADVVREPDMWDRARKIAKAMLDGRLWLPEVAKSTHYHAYWVRPSWVHEMKKMYKYGVHTFYRPRAWGDGSDAPSWGDAAQTAAISEQLAEAAKSSAELESK